MSEQSQAGLKARLDSEEGQRCLDEFVTLIAEWAAKSMPVELLQASGTPEGGKVLQKLWPRYRQCLIQGSLQPRSEKVRK